MNTIEVQVEVTQEDIDAGLIGSCMRCPLALAIIRRLDRADIEVKRFRYSIGHSNFWWPLPAECSLFVQQFDGCYPVAPFTFVLAVPEELVKR